VSNHSPITPPTELVQQWENRIFDEQENVDVLLIEAYKAGADQELEATLKLMATLNIRGVDYVRNARRSARASSLKEQALLQLDTLNADLAMHGRGCDLSQIRRALEALND
jgi:ADP-heptose:LPS heptosyltransferase